MNICEIKKLAAQGMSRVDIAKQLKMCRYPLDQICLKNNIKTVGKDNRIPMDKLVHEISKDLTFVVAFNNGITTSEIRRRFKYNNLSIDDIAISDNDMRQSIRRMVEISNQKIQGKTIKQDTRLVKFLTRRNDTVYGNKLTERLWRVCNDIPTNKIISCDTCDKPLKFYTYELGYGNSDHNICFECVPNHSAKVSGSRITSVPSTLLFNKLISVIPSNDIKNIQCSTINKKHVVYIPENMLTKHSNKIYYSLDFKYKNKVIEYDGDYWHSNINKETAKDNILNALGYDVLHVIHSEYIKDSQSILDECIEFLGVNDVN